jgi:predicted alpha/beta superfamily hydrolase
MTAVSLPRSLEEPVTIDGRDYRVLVAWPREEPPAAGFPIIYALDANASFATIVEAIRMRSHRPDATGVWPAIVAGVAYPGAGPYERVRRTYDYTQPGAAEPDGGDGRAAVAVGGGPRFLEFLRSDVTAIASRVGPVDLTRRTIIGHSLAGYFVLQTLVSAPSSFETYVAISPSIWWDRQGLFAAAKALRSRRSAASTRVKVMITVGEYEQKLAPWQADKPPIDTVEERRRDRRMVDHAREMASELTLLPNVLVSFAELAGQDHASVVPPSIGEAVRLAFA